MIPSPSEALAICKRWGVHSIQDQEALASFGIQFTREAVGSQIERLQDALENIALLDEADGHELARHHALLAVAIATNALGKHPSEIFAQRALASTLSGREP